MERSEASSGPLGQTSPAGCPRILGHNGRRGLHTSKLLSAGNTVDPTGWGWSVFIPGPRGGQSAPPEGAVGCAGLQPVGPQLSVPSAAPSAPLAPALPETPPSEPLPAAAVSPAELLRAGSYPRRTPGAAATSLCRCPARPRPPPTRSAPPRGRAGPPVPARSSLHALDTPAQVPLIPDTP